MKLVTTHTAADFDGFASMVAAHKLFPGLISVFPGSQEPGLRAYLRHRPVPIPMVNLPDLDVNLVDELLVVNATDLSRIGPLAEVARRPGVRLRFFDHHAPHDPIPDAEYTIRERGSTTTIFAELLQERGASLTPEEATILALGLYEKTCCFTAVSTAKEDPRAAAYVVEQGADLSVVFDYLHPPLNRNQLRLFDRLLAATERHVIYGVEAEIAAVDMEPYVPDAAAVVHRLHEVTRLHVVVALIRMDGKIHCIARSRNPLVDVGALTRALGGGGHAASSASVKNRTLHESKGYALHLLRDGVAGQLTAADLMHAPLTSVPDALPLRDAAAIMDRDAREALPVEREGALVGVVTRRILDQAVAHGLGGEAVAAYMDREFVRIGASATLLSVEAALEAGRGHAVIVHDEKEDAPRGIISREDLEMPLPRNDHRDGRGFVTASATMHPTGRNLGKLMRESLPPRIKDLFAAAAEVADRLGVGLYVVGGLVRDLLLRRCILDADLVIEGDGLAFANAFGEAVGAKVRRHDAFRTAALIFPDGFRLDIATARTEFYAEPGMLPEVATSSIRHDLGRRDFTINALAIKLNAPNANRLIDFFGGERDLKGGVIRVLHSLSFVDDPTRAFRAIRFEQRFGMRIGRQTMACLKNALKNDLFSRVSGPRLFNELRLTFEERDPPPALKRLDDLGLLDAVHPGLALPLEVDRRLEAIREALAWYDLKFTGQELVAPWTVYLSSLVRGLASDEVRKLARRLGVQGKTVERLVLDHRRMPAIASALQEHQGSAVQVVALCARLSVAGLIALMASLPSEASRQLVADYLRELRFIKPALTGRDLIDLGLQPGPRFGQILAAVKERKLRGELPTREAELDFVRTTYLAPELVTGRASGLAAGLGNAASGSGSSDRKRVATGSQES